MSEICHYCQQPESPEKIRTVMGEQMCLTCLHGEDNE